MKKTTTTQQDDPQVPQPDLRFVAKAAKQHEKKGKAQQEIQRAFSKKIELHDLTALRCPI